ncbi:MAG: TetR/AcrR family transcriptional regulator [Pseudomonadales bacterium]
MQASIASNQTPRETPEQRPVFIAALSVFAGNGFRRTSMVTLAEAIGVSRQTLYNRFKSKEQVLEWALGGLIEDLRADALGHLHQAAGTPQAVLLEVFCRWLGPLVSLLRNGSHGQEFLGLGTSTAHSGNGDDRFTTFTADIADYLFEQGLCHSVSAARERAFLLAMAAKGLLLISPSEQEFRTDMATALRGAGLEQPKR